MNIYNKKQKLTYITRVDISSGAAQARQIQSMARAYFGLLGHGFSLVSYGSPDKGVQYTHKRLKFDGHWSVRYSAACLEAAKCVFSNRTSTISTRDIVVAATVIVLGGSALYEAHDIPRNRVSRTLFKILASAKRFRMTVVCDSMADFYKQTFGIPDTHLLVARNGVFPELYSFLLEQEKAEIVKILGLPNEKIIILHTGSLYKGGAEIYEIAANYDAENIYFVHLGGSEKECQKWREYYLNKKIKNIEFISHKDPETVRKYQVAADLLFFISTRNSSIFHYTCPLKLFEYMASGTPILASNIGSVGEIMNETNSFCFDPEDEQTLMRAIDRFFGDKNEAQRRTQTALNAVQKQYSWHQRAQRIFDFATANKSR